MLKQELCERCWEFYWTYKGNDVRVPNFLVMAERRRKEWDKGEVTCPFSRHGVKALDGPGSHNRIDVHAPPPQNCYFRLEQLMEAQ